MWKLNKFENFSKKKKQQKKARGSKWYFAILNRDVTVGNAEWLSTWLFFFAY